jgi:hypothetical protein
MLKRIDGFLKPNFKVTDVIVVGQTSSLSGFCGDTVWTLPVPEKIFR